MPQATVARQRTADGPPPEPLTDRQSRILDAIRQSIARNGYPPSWREIADAVGLASDDSVGYQLGKLEEKGYLRRSPRKSRAIELLTPPAA